jgi:hypothetical protein
MPQGDNPKSRKNLQPNVAPDKPGDGRSVGVWLRNDQLEALSQLEGGRALHIRKAVDLYLEGPKTGMVSQGKTVVEAIANVKEATELNLASTWGDIGTCSHCEKIAPVAFTVDPYAFEVDNNDEEDWYCEDCYDQRKGDI